MVYAVPSNRLYVIPAKDVPRFFEEFNKNIPSKEFFEQCEKVSELFNKNKKNEVKGD